MFDVSHKLSMDHHQQYFSGLIARFHHAEFGQYAKFHKNPSESHENILEKCMYEFVTDSYEISHKVNFRKVTTQNVKP